MHAAEAVSPPPPLHHPTSRRRRRWRCDRSSYKRSLFRQDQGWVEQFSLPQWVSFRPHGPRHHALPPLHPSARVGANHAPRPGCFLLPSDYFLFPSCARARRTRTGRTGGGGSARLDGVVSRISRMKILPHTAPYPFTSSLLGVSEHVVVHAVGGCVRVV